MALSGMKVLAADKRAGACARDAAPDEDEGRTAWSCRTELLESTVAELRCVIRLQRLGRRAAESERDTCREQLAVQFRACRVAARRAERHAVEAATQAAAARQRAARAIGIALAAMLRAPPATPGVPSQALALARCVEHIGTDGSAPCVLRYAAWGGDTMAVDALLGSGDLQVAPVGGASPLWIAACLGHAEVARRLCAAELCPSSAFGPRLRCHNLLDIGMVWVSEVGVGLMG